MANEAILRQRKSNPSNFRILSTTAVEKGTICTMGDLLLCTVTSTRAAAVAGIAAREKIANDGRMSLALYTDGVFDMVASGSITVGAAVVTSAGGTNKVEAAAVNDENILGRARETASDGETIQIELNPFNVNLA